MAVSWKSLLTDILVALGDSTGVTWSRLNRVLPWCYEALLAFPILRPQLDDHTNGASVVYSLALPAGFREVISVEYPISQQPPVYLVRKNRLDPDFYNEAGYYDIDHDYSAGAGWFLYVSGGVAALAHVKTQFLSNHDIAGFADDDAHFISVPEEYEGVLIAYVVCRAYRERLGVIIQNPTAQTTIIAQVTDMVNNAEENYRLMVAAVQEKLADSKVTANLTVDKYDRVY